MQIEIVNLNDLIKKNHPYRTLLSIIDFSGIDFSGIDFSGIDFSGLAKNTVAKLFCDFSLISQTPDHSRFGEV